MFENREASTCHLTDCPGKSIDEAHNCDAKDQASPAAIVGMGLRLPGGIHTGDQLWELIKEKRSTRCEIPKTRFSSDGFHGSASNTGHVAMRHGHFLDDNDSLQCLDTSFFSMGMTEVSTIDPQQRMLLEVVYECMQTAGQVNWRGSNIGCYVGVWGEDWLDIQSKDINASGMYRVSGGHDFAISNRISYEYNLKGPSFTIKAGCSSSLIALHEAVRAIQTGDCDGAIVAGTNLIFSPTMSIAMTEQGVLSPDGSCKSFDAAANGYARGEAINAIFLKPLASALGNGDRVRAVVRATSTNSDGKTPGMSMPSSESHEALIRKAYAEAQLDPRETVFVEAHGTGTPVGDPLEANAIATVFGGRKESTVYFGSVKPNLGHSEGASGISSILRAILAMENLSIPPNLNFSTPNPQIPFSECNLQVPTDLIPWPRKSPVRVSVNSFGIGGANAHCIIESLEQYLSGSRVLQYASQGHSRTMTGHLDGLQRTKELPSDAMASQVERDGIDESDGLKAVMRADELSASGVDGHKVSSSSLSNNLQVTEEGHERASSSPTDDGAGRPGKVLYVLSATNSASLKRSIEEYKAFLGGNKANPTDTSYTLCNRREHLLYRSYCVSPSVEVGHPDAVADFSPLVRASDNETEVHMIFTGQGAQWAGMSKELIHAYPSFRDTIASLDKVLSRLQHPPTWSLFEELCKPEESSRVSLAEFSQPLVCAVQIGLVNLLRQWRVFPAGVVGHSSGEIVAAYASGALTAEEAISIAYYRGYVNRQSLKKQAGGMAAIGLGVADVSPYLIDGVVVACDNSPKSVTLSGDSEALETVCESIRKAEPDCLVRRLKVDVAYHSHHMRDIGDLFESLLPAQLGTRRPEVPMFSSVTLQQAQAEGYFDAAYWRRNLESPVLFTDAVKLLVESRNPGSKQVYLEVGPHNALNGPLRQIFQSCGTPQPYISAMLRGKDCVESILKAAGELFIQGAKVDLSEIAPCGNVIDLPLYPWQHDKEFWSEPRLSKEWRFRKFPQHELLGSRTLESTDMSPQWRNAIRLEQVPWLRDHKVVNDVVFPCAGYIAMAVEAIRQLSTSPSSTGDGVSLRSVIVRSAMVLTETSAVEVVTMLKPVRLTNTADSAWWEFTISSHNGTTWTKHCTGEVRTGQDTHQIKAASSRGLPNVSQDHIAVTYPRSVANLYADLRNLGLNYGTCFRGLQNVLCQPNASVAVATLALAVQPVSSYLLHPTTIDHCLQLFCPASCNGLFYQAEKLCLPTSIGKLYIANTEPKDCQDAIVRAAADVSSVGAIAGTAEIVSRAQGRMLLSLEDGNFTPLETDFYGDGQEDLVAGAYADWQPELDLADMSKLIRPKQAGYDDIELVEGFVLLSILEIEERTQDLITPSVQSLDHIRTFRRWISDQASQARAGSYQCLEQAAKNFASLSRGDRLNMLNERRQKVLNSTVGDVAIEICRILDRCEDIVEGRIEGIELLQDSDGLTNLYAYVGDCSSLVDFFSVAGHTRPELRVLEIGAGTGGTTQIALDGLVNSRCDERLYSTYVYTDISAGFFVEANERFKAYQNIEYRVLDISQDPIQQGFHPESFDLIIASNVFHATPSLADTLNHVRKIMAPDGYLLLQELCPKMRMYNLIMGILPGWWLGAPEGRVNEPFIDPEPWDELFQGSGFSPAIATILDAAPPYQINANMITRPVQTERMQAGREAETAALAKHKALPSITLLHLPGDESASNVLRCRATLENAGYNTKMISLKDVESLDFNTHQMIVSLLELEVPFFEAVSASDLAAFQNVTANLGTAQMLWIMRSAQEGIDSSSQPGFGMSLGLMRCVRSEQSLAITTLEIDTINDGAFAALTNLLRKLVQQDSKISKARVAASNSDPDREFVLVDGVIKVPRYRRVPLSQELSQAPSESEALTLEIGRIGLLQSLKWASFPSREPGPGEVVVDVRCAGLNFRDLLVCIGIVDPSSCGIGLEGSGVVTKVGQGVNHLKPGDHVFYMGDSCFSTRLTISARLCAKIPSSLPWDEAATMPCVYATVIHSLLDIGGLQAGQSILIHSACGGIGLAALNICSTIEGLEVYATVGNEDKIRYLVENFGLSRNNIFNSRDSSFLHDIQAATGGRGVDLVLNSLSGELLHASWHCVAPHGKMLEIGKRDFIGKGTLQMDLFESNRSFIGIDLSRMVKHSSAKCESLLKRTVEMLESGRIKHIKPLKVFAATEAEDAFRYMQNGTHLGKIVVTIPEGGSGISPAPVPLLAELNPCASYLLIGGLGGLGRAIATWMVERGARQFIFFSRSAGQKPEDHAFMQELEHQGCTVTAVTGSVSDIADVRRVIAAAPADKPIRGVLQLSMVLRDKPFADMNLADWEAAVKPKVQGTWNLHVAAPTDLDFFVVAGSISGTFGMPGQSNYAAGNTYLTSLIQKRRALGLPAAVLHIGIVGDIGYLVDNPKQADALQAAGGYFLRTRQVLDGLNWAMLSRRPSYIDSELSIGMRTEISLASASNRIWFKKDSRMGIYRNDTGQGGHNGGQDDEGASKLRILLASAETNPHTLQDKASLDLVVHELGVRIYKFMLRPPEDMDPTASLTSLGIDSLVTLEIRNWIKRNLGGLEFSSLEILNSGTIEGLGKLVMDSLRAQVVERKGLDMDAVLANKAP